MASVSSKTSRAIFCIILLLLMSQSSQLTYDILQPKNEPTNTSTNSSISPDSITIRLANNTEMANITFSYTASSNSQQITPNNMTLIKDIRNSGSSYPHAFAVMGNELIFAANDGQNGSELWKTDGTTNGTVLVKDINTISGAGSSIMYPVSIGNTVFFRATDASNGAELWKTDGTTNGTVLIKDINPGPDGSGITEMIAVDSKVFFKANDGVNGDELWVSDGTSTGTFMVKNIRSGAAGSTIAFMTSYNGKAYFRALDNEHGSEVWMSDGTPNGTEIMIDIRPGSAGNSMGGMEVAGDKLYFSARGTSGRAVYVSNGTANGTQQITDTGLASVNNFEGAGDKLFFTANYNSSGIELWVTNGTYNGTKMFDLLPGPNASQPKVMTYNPHSGNIYFYAKTPSANYSTAYEFWQSDGTENGTKIVRPGTAKDGWRAKNTAMVSSGQFMYYVMMDADLDGRNIYRTDGTVNGTVKVGGDLNGNYLETTGEDDEIIAFGNTLFSSMDGGGVGTELYGITNSTGIAADPTWSTYPILPQGITINTSTGEISGTPTMVQNNTQYTVWANTSTESSSAIVNIEIVGGPEFNYEPQDSNLVREHQIADLVPIITGGVVESWEIYPTLPSGLQFNTQTGIISGTPDTNQNTTTYTIWGNNSAGNHSFDITIKISEEPPNIVYQDPSIELTRYVLMEDVNPVSNGGLIDSWAITPELPLGLIFDNGTISGTPEVNSTEISYTVWANNSEGSDSDVVTIVIAEPPLGIVFTNDEITLVQGVEMVDITVVYIGGEITTWELEETLPLGLEFNTTTQTISGTTDIVTNQTTYTIWANSSTVSNSSTFTLTVLLDTDGDGEPDDFGNTPSTFLTEDADDDNDGILDADELLSDPLLPDTDGDGVCDGPVTVTYDEVEICTSGYDYFPTDPSADADTDGDGEPDEIRSGYNTSLSEDLDDDGDGLSDVNESLQISKSDPKLADTDGDGVCDGPGDVYIRDELICTVGPDAFPDDAAAYMDTDSDGKPDDLTGNSSTGLIEDLDDDGDQSSDIAENENGTDPKDPLSFPTDDKDSDGWTDSQELFCGTNIEDPDSVPDDFDADEWCDSDDPDDDNDDWTDSMEIDCGSNPLDASDVPGDDDSDGICNKLDSDTEESSFLSWWILPVLLLVILMVAGYIRMGRLSKQMTEVIEVTQHDATDDIWNESDEEDED